MVLVRRVRLITADPAVRYEGFAVRTVRNRSLEKFSAVVEVSGKPQGILWYFAEACQISKGQRDVTVHIPDSSTLKRAVQHVWGWVIANQLSKPRAAICFSLEAKKNLKKRTHNWRKLATLTAHKTVPQSLKSEEKKKTIQLFLSLMDLINHKGVNKIRRSCRMSAAAWTLALAGIMP